ncbi:MAG TPA: DUF87 domain-containing protein [Tepidisphaeraceae bacterium]|jgi:hypothetical protein
MAKRQDKAISIGKSEMGSVTLDPLTLTTSRLLVTANSGGGKSYLLRKLIERLGGSAQTFVLDMEGEFVTLREKLDLVIVGPGGEIPTDVRSAGLLVRRLMEKNISAVIDMSELRSQPRRQFVREFCETLIGLPKSLWRPLFVVLDEAHQFAPEKGQGEAESLSAVRDLCTLGRKRGFCPILATQRISTLDKSCSAECNNKFIGRMTLDNDIKRAAFELGVSPAETLKMLRDLPPGEFYSFGPAIHPRIVTKITVDEVETTHPKAGRGATLSPPKPSAAITSVVGELADLPKQAEAEIKDLAAAKAKISELQRQVAAKPAPAADAAALERAAAAARRPLAQLVIRLRAGLEQAMKVIAQIEAKGFEGTNIDPEVIRKAVEAATDQIVKLVQKQLDTRSAEFERLKADARKSLAALQHLLGEDVVVSTTVRHNEPFTVASPAPARARQAASAVAVPAGDRPDWFRPAHQRLLDAAARLAAMGMTPADRSLVAAVAGVSPKSSSFGNDVSRLSAGGYITYPRPGLVVLTEAGQALAAAPAEPPTLADLQQAWKNCPALRPAHVRLLEAVIARYPEPMTRAELAAAAGVSAQSSSFGNDVSRLSTMGLIRYPSPGVVVGGELLFPEGLT